MIFRSQMRICKTNVRINLMIGLFISSVCGLISFSLHMSGCVLYRCREESEGTHNLGGLVGEEEEVLNF
jgi:hypothetical protein